MIDVREVALAALAAEVAAKQARENAEERQKREMIEAERATVEALIGRSVLPVWFPGVEWEVYEVRGEHSGYFGPMGYSLGVVCAGRPEGTDPGFAGVPVFALALDSGLVGSAHVQVYCVRSEHSEGYESWQGPQVKSLEDVGRAIMAFERQWREAALKHADGECKCVDPCERGLRCAHARVHCALLTAIKTSRCQMEVAAKMRDQRAWRGMAEDYARTADRPIGSGVTDARGHHESDAEVQARRSAG